MKKKKKNNHSFMIRLILLLLGICVIGICIGIIIFHKKETEEEETTSNVDYEEYLDIIDTDEYYEENATVIEAINIKKSKNIQKEKDAYKTLTERGFDQNAIISEYDMDGNYLDTTEISEDSEEEHPIYYTNYTTTSGDVWTIMIVNDALIAFPVTYNTDHTEQTETLISENETVTCYDGYKNKFYKIKPHEDFSVIKQVTNIDSDTIESLSEEAIEKL